MAKRQSPIDRAEQLEEFLIHWGGKIHNMRPDGSAGRRENSPIVLLHRLLWPEVNRHSISGMVHNAIEAGANVEMHTDGPAVRWIAMADKTSIHGRSVVDILDELSSPAKPKAKAKAIDPATIEAAIDAGYIEPVTPALPGVDLRELADELLLSAMRAINLVDDHARLAEQYDELDRCYTKALAEIERLKGAGTTVRERLTPAMREQLAKIARKR
jgi:hypothetical protein